jgi:hypothetical protein
MATVRGWIKVLTRPAVLALLAALVVGQVVRIASQSFVDQPHPVGQIPLVAAGVLGVGFVLATTVVWIRVRLGNQLAAGAYAQELKLLAPASLLARYAVADPPGHVVEGGLAVVDLVLLLLVQSTLRQPAVAIAQDFVPRAWADAAFVSVVVLLSLLLLAKLYRTAGPVFVLALWWGLDRVIPTAGFAGARPAVVAPQLAVASAAPTVISPRKSLDAESTVVAPHKIVEAEPTVVAPEKPVEAEPTMVAASKAEEATVVSERTVVAPEAP